MVRQAQPTPEGAGTGNLHAALLRVLDARGGPVGVAFLVTEDRALTCAHVVTAALRAPDGPEPDVGTDLPVDLPLVPGGQETPITARVEVWGPGLPDGAQDVAVLRLPSVPPGSSPGTSPVQLVTGRDLWNHPARVFGLPVGRPGGVWHYGRLRAVQADGWVQLDLTADGYRVSGGFSGAPVWDDELNGVVGMVVAAESGEPPASYLLPTRLLAGAWPPLSELALPPSPFRGLAAFRESDASEFHGRARESGEVAGLVAAQPRTLVVGPSGCGKSSLAMAGVVPRLRAEGYAVAVVRPGTESDPLTALAAALVPLLEPGAAPASPARPDPERAADVAELSALLVSQRSLADVAPSVLRVAGAERLLIVVDQLEELLAAEPAAVDRFAELLFGADALPAGVHVLATLRGDFLQAALDHPRIGAALPRRPYVLRVMTSEQLREVVTAPVASVPSVSYQPGLVRRILDDAGDTPGALPLLGLTLDLLWQRQRDGLLTHAAYERLGRVAGALRQHADEAWAECVGAADEEAARRLLGRLIRLPLGAGSVTRRTAPRRDLDDEAWRIAGRLAATRLLVAGRDAGGGETVELAHDALITAWPRLADWVSENRSFLGWRESLRHDMDRWQEHGRRPDLLPGPVTLASAEPWLGSHAGDLTDAERDYLQQGRARQRTRARRRRRFFTGLGLIAVLALVLGTLLGFQRRQSRAQQKVADSRALAQLSADRTKADPVLSTMLALAAYRTSPTTEAASALMRSYVQYAGTARQLAGLPDTLGGYQTSADGQVVLARSSGGKARLYVHAATGEVRSERLAQPVQALFPLVSRDGGRAGYVGLDGSLVWYRVNRSAGGGPIAGPPHRLPAAHEVTQGLYDDHRAALSPDGRVAVAASGTHIVSWDLDRGTLTRVPAPKNIAYDLALWAGADDRTALVQTATGRPGHFTVGLDVIDRLTGTVRPLQKAPGVDQVQVSGDSTAAVTCRRQGGRAYYSVLPVTGGRAVRGFSEKADLCRLQAVDGSGQRAVLQDGNNIRLVGLAHGTALSRIVGVGAGGSEISLSYAAVGSTPTVIGIIDNRLSYNALTPELTPLDIHTIAFTGRGGTMVGVVKGGSRIQVRAVDEPDKVLADAARPTPYWDTTFTHEHLQTNDDGTLVADRDGQDSISVRRLPTLRRTARITPAPPPPTTGEDPTLTCFFDRSGHLVTVSGTVIQQWNPSTGRQLARFDASVYHPDTGSDGAPELSVAPYPEGDAVAVTVTGDPRTHLVDLAKGRETAHLTTGKDATGVEFDPGGRHLAILRRGGLVELWRRHPWQRELGPLPVVLDDESTARFIGDRGRFLVAVAGKVRVYRVAEHSYDSFYELGGPAGIDIPEPYSFPGAAADGTAVLYTDIDGDGGPVPLDPALWERRLCQVIGYRDFTTKERSGLPTHLPTGRTCPRSSAGTGG
ncbi:trypsin-like peptidase domain-containing protein [Streptomyces sediminimaris]|uniref:nSTAND1 domain-containing NTPase n=1 Tax=Streptomyces sediminimaris TaxID=3383721 RepID=UPI00399B307A